MGQAERINKLLMDARLALDQYEQERKERGIDFNVFEILDINEVPTCRMLHALLDPKGKHGFGGLFLKLFLQNVLKQDTFSDKEINQAVVIREKSIITLSQEARRIDLYIRVGGRTFPIEVKLGAPDSGCQCYDYYHYVKDTDDPDAVIYYLTLDSHLPDAKSRNGLEIGKELRLISFEREIRDWLHRCLEQEEVRQSAAVRIAIEQFLDNINRLTGKRGEALAMKLIKDFETFKTADMIAESLQEMKIKKMKEVFKGIEEELGERGYKPILPTDYRGKIEKYYRQSTSTYPSLNYYVDEEKSLVLRIEADWNLYFGICQWDKANNCVAQKLEQNQEAVDAKAGEYLTKEASESYYRWEYLPDDDNPIHFKECVGSSYAELFNKEKRKDMINEICGAVERLLKVLWKKA